MLLQIHMGCIVVSQYLHLTNTLVVTADLAVRQTIWCWMNWEQTWSQKQCMRRRQNSTCLTKTYFRCFLCNNRIPLLKLVST